MSYVILNPAVSLRTGSVKGLALQNYVTLISTTRY